VRRSVPGTAELAGSDGTDPAEDGGASVRLRATVDRPMTRAPTAATPPMPHALLIPRPLRFPMCRIVGGPRDHPYPLASPRRGRRGVVSSFSALASTYESCRIRLPRARAIHRARLPHKWSPPAGAVAEARGLPCPGARPYSARDGRHVFVRRRRSGDRHHRAAVGQGRSRLRADHPRSFAEVLANPRVRDETAGMFGLETESKLLTQDDPVSGAIAERAQGKPRVEKRRLVRTIIDCVSRLRGLDSAPRWAHENVLLMDRAALQPVSET
jgi:hypothetical protein